MMESPIISIIVPVYNVERYLSRCIESILSQTYHNLEVILINDGSTDHSLEIAKSYSDNRIRIINKDNSGQSDCRNIGFHEAIGDYLFFMDSDDTLSQNAIQDLYEHISQYDADICCCRFCLIDENGNNLKVSEPYEQEILDNNEIILKEALTSGQIKGTLWTKLFKKSFLSQYGLEPERRIKLHDDCMFSFLTAIYAKRVCFTQGILYNVLQRSDSISRTCKPIMVTVYQDIYQILKESLDFTGKWEMVKDSFYGGYSKSMLYALILAAVRSNSFGSYLNIFRAIKHDDFYYSADLKNSLGFMSIKLRALYMLSRRPRVFYFLINTFSHLFNH